MNQQIITCNDFVLFYETRNLKTIVKRTNVHELYVNWTFFHFITIYVEQFVNARQWNARDAQCIAENSHKLKIFILISMKWLVKVKNTNTSFYFTQNHELHRLIYTSWNLAQELSTAENWEVVNSSLRLYCMYTPLKEDRAIKLQMKIP